MTNEEKIFNVAILVLGDLNRSPRMLNHCVALSESFPTIQEISLIGYDSTDIRKDISSNNKCASSKKNTNLGLSMSPTSGKV